jgi:hypothetical protein
MLALLTDRYSLVLTDTKADVAIPMHRECEKGPVLGRKTMRPTLRPKTAKLEVSMYASLRACMPLWH